MTDQQVPGDPPIALWAVPRSISSAFERMMRARGDVHVLYEPFQDYYYFSDDRITEHFSKKKAPDPSFHYAAIVERILSADRPTFFKDMAYHLSACMTPELLSNFRNTFLIRHPRWVLPSLYKLHPACSLEETGFDQQLRLMRMASQLGEPLVIVDAEELRTDPANVVRDYCTEVALPFMESALHWEPGDVPDWEPFRDWHTEASRSTGFKPTPAEAPDLSLVPSAVYEHCATVFEEIAAYKQDRVSP